MIALLIFNMLEQLTCDVNKGKQFSLIFIQSNRLTSDSFFIVFFYLIENL